MARLPAWKWIYAQPRLHLPFYFRCKKSCPYGIASFAILRFTSQQMYRFLVLTWLLYKQLGHEENAQVLSVRNFLGQMIL